MGTVERRTSASPAEVWDVLANGWTFAAWVVGASRVRAVEPGWPAVGTHVHHSVGTWPAVLDDNTVVEVSEPAQRLVMLARTRPVGQARVEITMTPDGTGTLLTMSEDYVTGPAKIVPHAARQAALKMRNVETVHRLALLAERCEQP